MIQSSEIPSILRPKKLDMRRLLLSHFHWKCLICSMLIIFCSVHISYCHIFGPKGIQDTLSQSVAGPCSHGYDLIPMALAGLLYIIYLSECWHYRTLLSVPPRMGARQAKDLASAMRNALPIVWWKSISYHYLRRTRRVIRYRNGEAITRIQVYYERVNSHQSGNVFLTDQCGYKDITKELNGLDDFPVVRMRFTKGFLFASVEAANEFEEQRSRFFTENEMLDEYMEVREGLDLANLPFLERVLVIRDKTTKIQRQRRHKAQIQNTSNTGGPQNCIEDANRQEEQQSLLAPQVSSLHGPWWLSPWAFWPASLLLLSWPLRMIAEYRTGYVHLQVCKLFGTNYLSPSSINYTGPLTRTSTMDSHELNLAYRQNYVVVPSYSEAILLDPYNNNNEQWPTTERSQFTASSLLRQLFSSPHRLSTDRQQNIQSQYGSTGNRLRTAYGEGTPKPIFRTKPSRSATISCFNSNENIRTTQRHLPRPSTLLDRRRALFPRSITISEGISPKYNTLINDQQNIGDCSDRIPLLHQQHLTMEMFTTENQPQDEPPPPYEIALRYCSPIYQRLQQSAHSLSSLFSWSRRISHT